MQRREFFALWKGLLAVAGLLAAAPPAAFWAFQRRQPKNATAIWSDAGSWRDLPDSGWIQKSVTIVRKNLWRQETASAAVYFRKNDDQVEAISPVCPHAGCLVVIADQEFRCPCHKSSFDSDGLQRQGPSPRRLDRLPCKVENGRLKVSYSRFRSGTAERQPLEF